MNSSGVVSTSVVLPESVGLQMVPSQAAMSADARPSMNRSGVGALGECWRVRLGWQGHIGSCVGVLLRRRGNAAPTHDQGNVASRQIYSEGYP